MANIEKNIDWVALRMSSNLIKRSQSDLEMLGVIADICDFQYRNWICKLKLVVRRLLFVGLPASLGSSDMAHGTKSMILFTSSSRKDYLLMIRGLERRLDVKYCCHVSSGTKWIPTIFFSNWFKSFKSCKKYSLFSNKNIFLNVFTIISAAHALRSKKKLVEIISLDCNTSNVIVFMNAANCLESVWCSAFESVGCRKTICLQHAHYFEFHKDNIPFDNINYFNIAARNFIGWTRQVHDLLSELNVNLDIYVGGEIVKSNSSDILSAFNFKVPESIVVFLARDFHLDQNKSLLIELRNAGICKINVCLHPSSSKKLYENISGLCLEFIDKSDGRVQDSIVFVSSTSVYFDLLKRGIFTVLFVTSQSEFNGLVEVRNSSDIKYVINNLEVKRLVLLEKSSDFLKSSTGYLRDDYLSIFDKIF